MSSIGSVLKEARTKKDITLEDVHAKLKIHPRVLQLLEEEKFDKLPSPLFAKSFLKTYAQFLEVDADSLLEDYEREKKAPEPEQRLYLKPANMDPARRIPTSWWVGGLVVGLLLVVVFAGPPRSLGAWFHKVRQQVTSKKTEKQKPAEKKAPAPRVPQPAPVEASPEDNWLHSVKLGNFPKLNKKQPLELEIKALDAVWVHVTADGKVIFQGVIKKGSSEALRSENVLEVWTGNASNMALTLNKNSLGSPGKGVVKKMIISREGIRIAPPAES